MRSPQEWREDVRELMREIVPAVEEIDEAGPEGWRPDIVLRSGDDLLALELNVVRAPRIADVEGRLAKSVLRFERYAGQQMVGQIVMKSIIPPGSNI